MQIHRESNFAECGGGGVVVDQSLHKSDEETIGTVKPSMRVNARMFWSMHWIKRVYVLLHLRDKATLVISPVLEETTNFF